MQSQSDSGKLPLVPDEQAFVALGFLSTADTCETGRAHASRAFHMRLKVREASRLSAPNPEDLIAVRFVLSITQGRTRVPPSEEVKREAQAFGDIVFLNMTERFYLCAWKQILWLRYASNHFKRAQFIGIADSDSFVQLAHLLADLKSVHSLIEVREVPQFVVYGLILWKAYYNRISDEPATEFSGGTSSAATAVVLLTLRVRIAHFR